MMSSYPLEPVRYEKPAGIEAEYFLVGKSAAGIAPVLVVSFTGSAPDGSAGRVHAAYVSYAAMCGLLAFDPWAIVLDFRELEYRWGNSMLGVFQDISRYMDADREAHAPPYPVVPVVSERSSGFESMLRPSNERADHPSARDLDAAIETAIRLANEWIDA
jgi:hypothetical protein